jgi:transposase
MPSPINTVKLEHVFRQVDPDIRNCHIFSPVCCIAHSVAAGGRGVHPIKWRAKFGGMDASLIAEMKDMAEQNRRLKKMYAEMSMQNELLKEALGKKR